MPEKNENFVSNQNETMSMKASAHTHTHTVFVWWPSVVSAWLSLLLAAITMEPSAKRLRAHNIWWFYWISFAAPPLAHCKSTHCVCQPHQTLLFDGFNASAKHIMCVIMWMLHKKFQDSQRIHCTITLPLPQAKCNNRDMIPRDRERERRQKKWNNIIEWSIYGAHIHTDGIMVMMLMTMATMSENQHLLRFRNFEQLRLNALTHSFAAKHIHRSKQKMVFDVMSRLNHCCVPRQVWKN